MSTNDQTILYVAGMTCRSCISHVSDALLELEGVRDVDVRLLEGKVVVRHDAAEAPLPRLIEALAEAGYDARAARGPTG